MAAFNDLNDDVLLILIDFLAGEGFVRDTEGIGRNHLVALSSTNRRLRYLTTQVATRSLFDSVLMRGRSLPARLDECIYEGRPLDIPQALERTRSLRIPRPFESGLERNQKGARIYRYEITRLLRTPQRLEKLDVGHSRIFKTARRDRFSRPFFRDDKFSSLPFAIEASPPLALNYVKELSIHQNRYLLGPLCPNVESIKVKTSSGYISLPVMLGKFSKLSYLISLELDQTVGPELVQTVYEFLPNLKRLVLTGSGLNMISVETRQRIISALAHFPRLHTISFHHDFKPSSRPWGDSPDEPPDYRMDCLVGGPSLESQVTDCTRSYLARHVVRFFEGCLALANLFLNPLNEFHLLRREPDLAITWVQKEKSEERSQDDAEAWSNDYDTSDEEDDRVILQSMALCGYNNSYSGSE
ncbi:hypothetical protein IWX90DRAFT_419526 [Phyllosticta citrichinensis]|uniref:Uncharacterized protein n=1 Tax=Phyllosticta citrichinensis TaxID=1130410 RepID=A0ABR1Y5H3_9PEZI